jgi:hypothetical protein
VKWFHSRNFCLRDVDSPEPARASGDSGFVAHLTACTHGATGWDWSFRLVKPGSTWAFVSDGRLTIFLDEAGQFVPADAAVGDMVAVRLPRARENFFTQRFSVYGGQGGVVVGQGFVKLFVPVTFAAGPALVEAFAGRLADQLRFSLYLSNNPRDFDRADSAVVDFSPQDETGVLKILETFSKANPGAFQSRGLPHGTDEGPLKLPRALGIHRGDVADGFGWRRAQEAVASGLEARR